MRFATWNVNSLRKRIERVEGLLVRHDLDVLAVQEVKAREDQLPLLGLRSLGYDIAVAGTNQWNGVAIISRVGLDEVRHGFTGMPQFRDVAESRVIAARCAGVDVWSLYVPNGRKVDDPHYHYKLQWLDNLRAAVRSGLATPTLLAGDWNIAPTDDDVYDITAFARDTHVTAPERAAFQGFLDDGFVDVVRPHCLGPDGFTYWDYYRQRFERNKGMRIDFALASPELASRTRHAFVDRDERAAPAASDHAPVIVEFDAG